MEDTSRIARSIDALPPTPPSTPCAAPAHTGTRNCPRLGVRRRRGLASRGTTQRDVGQPNVTASPRLAALARRKYHSNNSVSELSGEQINHATEVTRQGQARFNSFCAENPFYHNSVLSHFVPRSIEASNYSRGVRSFEGATHDHPNTAGRAPGARGRQKLDI